MRGKVIVVELGKLAVVRSGLVLKRKESKSNNGIAYPLLNLKSFREDAVLQKDSLDTFFASEKLDQSYLTQCGDIVVRLSFPYTAVLIDSTTEGIVISSNFVVIRINTETILSEYLYWLLNSEAIKKDISKNVSTNALGTVRPQYYNNLKIHLLPIDQQKTIATIHQLSRKETYLLKKLIEEKERYYTELLRDIDKEMRNIK